MRVTAKSLIRRHIMRLPEGTLFATRNVLGYGHRPAVDQVLSRLVKDGFIRRVARGIFVRDPALKGTFTIWDIAKLKSESFQRKMAKHSKTKLEEIFRNGDARQKTIFAINGSTSKFKVGETIIHLKESCQRKAALSETEIGQRMKALWLVGKNTVTPAMIREAIMCHRGGASRISLRANISLLPAWLSDQYLDIDTTFRYMKAG